MLVSGGGDRDGGVTLTAAIYPEMEAVKEALGPDPDEQAIRALLEEEVRKVNGELVSYKRIRRVHYRDSEFEKTTSRKIRRQYQ